MAKVCAAALLALSVLATGCGLVTRPVDVYSRAFFIADHWNDPKLFPPKANLCMETFCRRVDTTKQYVGGHKGYTSQVYYRYCPAHSPSFVATGSRLDGFFYFVYWTSCFFIGWFGLSLILGLPGIGVAKLWLLVRGEKREPDLDRFGTLVAAAAGAINVVVFVMFAYW